MRQAGIIAAGALYALEHHRDRLAEDHANAKKLASAIAALPGIECDAEHVETNIIYIKSIAWPAADMVQKLKTANLLVLPSAHDTIRAVTNLMITPNQIDEAIAIFKSILET